MVLDFIRHYTYLTPAEWACLDSVRATHGDPRTCGEGTWTSWSLVDFRYRRHDVLGYFFAVSSFLPLVIIIFLSGLASAPCAQRRVPSLVLLLCLIGNTALNTCIKAIVRSPRPSHPAARAENYSTVHGMPSDHAQFCTFFVTYLSIRAHQLFSSERDGSHGEVNRSHARAPRQALPVPMRLFFLAAATVVAAGRVYNGYHTVEQVVTGAALGACVAVVCTRPAAQGLLTKVAERVMLPLMLLCTSWTRYIG